MMRKIIEVDKFFVNSVFFMKKTCFFRISDFTFQIFLYIFRICSFGSRSRNQHPKSGQRPLNRRGRLQSHYMGTLALWRKDGGVIIRRRVTGRKARTRAPSGRINWQIRAHLGFRFSSTQPPLYQESVDQSYFLRFAPSQSELLSR